MSRNDRAVEALTPFLFLLIGIGMVVTAAAGGLADSVAVAFATLGTSLIVLGGVVRIIEGAVEIGPQGLKAQLRQRQAAVIDALSSEAPEAANTVDRLIDWVAGTDTAKPLRSEPWRGIEPPYIKGPSLVVTRDDGRATEIDISALKRAARGADSEDDDDAEGTGAPVRGPS